MKITTIVGLTITNLFCIASVSAQDQDSPPTYSDGMGYVSINVQADNADTRAGSALISLPLVQHLAAQAWVGQLRDNSSDDALDLTQFGFALGGGGQHVSARFAFDSHSGDDYRQRDISANADWSGTRGSVGVDLLYRKTDSSTDSIVSFPSLGLTNVAMRIDETYTGKGFGAHGSIHVTDRFTLSAQGIAYEYDNEYQVTSSTNPILFRRLLVNRPTLIELLYLNYSGITRSLALLDSSIGAGMQYAIGSGAIGLDYYYDTALDDSDRIQSFLVSAAVPIGDHWELNPLLGYTRSDVAEAVTFGGVGIRYYW